MAKISLIISVYRDTKNLKIILDALERQTQKDFEVIISEDCDYEEMKEFVKNCKYSFNIIHSFHEDLGWRKNRALNNALRRVTSEYIIFIDGDCVPHYRFIENHLKFSKRDTVLSGRRVNLGESFSQRIQNGELQTIDLDKSYLSKIFTIKKDPHASFVEEGVYVDSNSLFYKILNRKKRTTTILGCNFSCSKYALEKINGFDEDYIAPGIGEDVDIEWRLRKAGFEFKSLKNLAIQYHLHHERGYEMTDKKVYNKKLQEGIVYCKNGLDSRS